MTDAERVDALWAEIEKRTGHHTLGADNVIKRLLRAALRAVRQDAIAANGSKGGKSAAKRLSPAARRERAIRAADARWNAKIAGRVAGQHEPPEEQP